MWTSASPCIEVALAHPCRNRLLLFEGDRYHAVMHPSPRSAQGQRVTVLINWWRERPGAGAYTRPLLGPT